MTLRGSRRKARKLAAPPHPVRLERRMEREVLKLLRPVRALLRELESEQVSEADTLRALRGDQLDTELSRAIIVWLRGLISESVAQEVAEQLVMRVEEVSSREAGLWLNAMTSTPVERLATESAMRAAAHVQALERIADTTRYISSITEELASELEEALLLVVDQGERSTSLTDALASRLGVAESRAKLIARDQVGKAQSAIVQARQQAAGITRYEWVTSGDERVRESHRALQGQIFRWDAPPPVGHPGHDINCRCIAIPVIDPIDAD